MRNDQGQAAPKPAVNAPAAGSNPDKSSQVRYGIQVLVTSKTMKVSDPFFRGYKPVSVKVGNLNKYIIGVSTKKDEARATFARERKNFSGSFLVEIDGDVVKPLK